MKKDAINNPNGWKGGGDGGGGKKNGERKEKCDTGSKEIGVGIALDRTRCRAVE